MWSTHNSKGNKSPDPVFVLMGSIVLLLLGMATGLTFFAFAGLGIFIISIILIKEEGLSKPSIFTGIRLPKRKKASKKSETPSVDDKKCLNTEKDEVSQNKKVKQKSSKASKVISDNDKSFKVDQNDIAYAESLMKDSENSNVKKMHHSSSEKMEHEIEKESTPKKVIKKEELLQKEEAVSEENTITNVHQVQNKKEQLVNLEVFKAESGGRYQYISFRVKEKVIQLLSDEEMEKLEEKKRMKLYNNSKFRRYCDDVYYNDVFFLYHEKLIPIAMIDGIYLYRDTIRMQLCNGQLLGLQVHHNNIEIITKVAKEFAENVLQMSLLPKEKIDELNEFSVSRLQKMIKDYKNGVLQPLDYVIGDKNELSES